MISVTLKYYILYEVRFVHCDHPLIFRGIDTNFVELGGGGGGGGGLSTQRSFHLCNSILSKAKAVSTCTIPKPVAIYAMLIFFPSFCHYCEI